MPAVITEQSTVLESLHLVVVLLSTSLFLPTTIFIFCLKNSRQKPGASPPGNDTHNVAPDEDRKKKNVETNEKKNAEKVSEENVKTGAHSATPRKNQNATPKKERTNATSERKMHERIQLEKTAHSRMAATQPSAEPDWKQESKLTAKPRNKKTADGKALDRSEDGSDTLKSVESIQNPAEGVQDRKTLKVNLK
ncbi:hypothetical protein GCK32_008831 [Trichostrongylus colubriformis]|uniref:Uncharacterized protein n=1 Tax=Trichostrongylus colubriformis TaxID=6319 RepID=A0AAN8F473_TRICO